MRTLSEIRKANKATKAKDLLFVGMESKPVNLPTDLYNNEQKTYDNIVRPTVKDVANKYWHKEKK